MNQAAEVRAPASPLRNQVGTGNEVRRAALLGGVALILMAVLAVFSNFMVLERLVTPGDAAKTATDIGASKGVFAWGIAGWVAIVVLDLFAAWALFRVLRPAGARLAFGSAAARVIYGIVLGAAVYQLIAGLRLLTDGATQAVEAQALLKFESFTDIWYAGLVLFGVHLLVAGYLIFRSTYLPRFAGIVTGLAGAGYLFDAAVRLFVPDPAFSLSAITGMGEFVLAVWMASRWRSITPRWAEAEVQAVPVPAI